MKKIFLTIISLFFMALSVSARSLVLTLNDAVGTRVYFKVDRTTSYVTPIREDGTITLCGRDYQLMDLKSMSISSTDYSGERGTEDGTDVVVRGDANDDSMVSMTDVMYIINYILDSPAEDFNFEGADANQDGDITMSDVMFDVNFILNGYSSSENAGEAASVTSSQTKPNTMWFSFDDRFTSPSSWEIAKYDTLSIIKNTSLILKSNTSGVTVQSLPMATYEDKGAFLFHNPGRWLVKSNTYSSCDYTKETSQWCFLRSAESEHFIIFWENGMTKTTSGNITYSGYTCNVNTLLNNAEKIWDCYVSKLGFLEPGNSTTDNVKIQMYIVKNGWNGEGDTWRADGSGVDGNYYTYSGSSRKTVAYKTGIFHCTTRAATARNGHTPAHEIGHTFQYLVSADLGDTHGLNYGFGANASGGNEWWEDCANWQAYKVYPSMQFTDGEYYELYLNTHHLNIHHESGRYNNCFYQDYWCQQHGMNTVGRVWREATKPEDPSEAYMHIFGLDIKGYGDEMYQAYAHLTTFDIDNVRSYGEASGKIGNEPQRLVEVSDAVANKYLDGDKLWWMVDSAYCPQNFGYNANPLKVPAAGTIVKAQFKGIVGAKGYRNVNASKAGWRYGLVAYCSDGQRYYSDVKSDAEGEVTMTVPEKCKNLWLVVMGAPTEYWRHPWDDDATNDEQWPYAVRFTGTDAYGASHTYGEYPEDYARKDTTVVLEANLSYSSSSYSSIRVQYDMDAISQALGVSTAQMKSLKSNTQPGTKGTLVFAGVNSDGKTFNYNTTTSTSSSTVYGHWFTTSGNVCGYGSSSAIFAELYPDKYGCYVGQYPARLTKGKTYTICQAIIYTHTDGKQYKAIMKTHLTVR